MYNDLFSIGPVTIHGYGLMIGLGVMAALLLAYFRAPRKNLSQDAVLDLVICALIFGFIGSKLLYVLVSLPQFLAAPLSVLGSEGFVIYGGILGGLCAMLVYCRRKKLLFLDYFDLLVPSVALAQGFGRVGCFLAGCCYGRETSGALGVIFPAGSMAPAGVRLLPTQLISSAGDLLFAAILLLYARKSKRRGDVGALYLLLYGVGRFLVEFLRNDYRGELFGLSTSQFISIFIVLGGGALLLWNRKRKEPHASGEADRPEETPEAKAAEDADLPVE